MKVSEVDIFCKKKELTFTEIPDGLAVHDNQNDAIHFLNPVASTVFLLCDGAHNAMTIALILNEEFSLEAEPIQDVLNCLENLENEHIIYRLL